MKTFAIVLGTMALATVLVIAGVWLGVAWTQGRWGYGMMGPGMMSTGWSNTPRSEGQWGYGIPSTRLRTGVGSGCGNMPWGEGYVAPGDGDVTSPFDGAQDRLEEVQEAIERYVDRLGYTGLHVTEVMEFERNYYAIVAEEETGIGAMELLVDKRSGAVGPEPGPNMMWNVKYGMMGRGGMPALSPVEGMGGYSDGEMVLSPDEAQDAVQRWLDANLPGRTAGEADPFYGYYTLHFLNDGEIEGMLSVHGSSGDVWYHSWHGDFLAMAEGHPSTSSGHRD